MVKPQAYDKNIPSSIGPCDIASCDYYVENQKETQAGGLLGGFDAAGDKCVFKDTCFQDISGGEFYKMSLVPTYKR